MKQVNFKFIDMLKKFKSGVVLTFLMAFFSIAMLSNASAQSHPGLPGYEAGVLSFAQKLNIDAKPIGTWTTNKVVNAVKERLQNLPNENQSQLQVFETKYYNGVIESVSYNNDDSEVAVIKVMEQVFNNTDLSEYSQDFMITYMKELYNSLIQRF